MKAAERFFAEAIAEYGIEEGGVVRIPMTQCELARRRRLAASTVGVYLKAIEPRVVQRTPEIVLRTHEATALGSAERPDGALLAAYRVLVAAQARIIELLEVPARSARNSREPARDSRDSSRLQDQESEEEGLLPFFFHREVSRADLADRARWNDEQLDEVLSPLHRAVRRAGLQPMNNRRVLATALAPFTLSEIGVAVEQLVSEANRQGTSLRSPFGLLVEWARAGELPAAVESVAAAPLPAEDDEPPSIPAHVRVVVEALAPEELASLDRFIDHQLGGGSQRRPPAMRAALRLDFFQKWDTPSTPRAHHEDTPSTQKEPA